MKNNRGWARRRKMAMKIGVGRHAHIVAREEGANGGRWWYGWFWVNG